MAKTIPKGKIMTKTGRWWLTPKRGKEREFSGTLLKTFMIGKKRIALFVVPTGFK